MRLFRFSGQSRRRRARAARPLIAEECLEPRQLLSGVSVAPSETTSSGDEASGHSGTSFSETEILVRFADDFDLAAHLEAEQGLVGPSRIGQLGPGFQADPQLYEIPVSAPEHLHVMVSHMQSLDAVEIASLNPTGSFATVPNDPQLGSQWGLQAINAPAAWDIRSDSSDVIVAIADTGVTAHPDLTDNLWINLGEIPDNGIDDDGNGYTDDLLGWDGVFNSPDVSDFAAAGYHGTSVSGVAGASGNNARGVSGVSWDASLMTIRGTFFSEWIRGIDYALQNGAQVINNSWGFEFEPAGLRALFERAEQAGVLMVNAAGNDPWNLDEPPTASDSSAGGFIDVNRFLPDGFLPDQFFPDTSVSDILFPGSGGQAKDIYPAEFSREFDNVITVAATNSSGQLASFSAYGKNTVQIAAPGQDILTTNGENGYRSETGTSFAAPMVSSAAALVWAERPELTAPEVKQILLDSAQPRLLDRVSDGVLDLHGALTVARDLNLTDPSVFDPRLYLDLHPDVAAYVGANNLAGARAHWLEQGVKEGRAASVAFDVQVYQALNPDLVSVFGRDNYQALIRHWVGDGMAEGRTASTIFDAKTYETLNPDLRSHFGAGNYEELVDHWIQHGLWEGRTASTVFDVDFYGMYYTDLSENPGERVKHWITQGISQGRRGSVAFDASQYALRNPAVADTVGHSNYEGLLTHWLSQGMDEGRESSREFDVSYYLSAHSGLRGAFGASGYRRAVTHFLQYGQSEGRRTNEDFGIKSYASRYADLSAYFGTDYDGLWRHWLSLGQYEGRNPQ